MVDRYLTPTPAYETKPQMRVFILTKIQNLPLKLSEALPEVSFRCIPIEVETVNCCLSSSLAELQQAEVLIADQSEVAKFNLVQNLPNLKWLQGTWAGVETIFNTIDTTKVLPSFTFTRLGGCLGPLMAEYVMAQIIACERNFHGLKKAQDQKQWTNISFSSYRSLSQLQLGILGAGDIGREVAKAAKAFNMKVKGLVNHCGQESDQYVDKYCSGTEGLSEVLSTSDYITNVLPSTPATQLLLSGDRLGQCLKQPVLINIGRGDVIDDNSLLMALSNGWLRHAVLDVFDKEPLPCTSSLWTHPNVTITPHVSGVTFDWQVVEVFKKNWMKFLLGEKLDYEVDWKKGY